MTKALVAHSFEIRLNVVVKAVEHSECFVDGRRIGGVKRFEDSFTQGYVPGDRLVPEARRDRKHVAEDTQSDLLILDNKKISKTELNLKRRRETIFSVITVTNV